MSVKARVWGIVAVAAVVVAGLTVGITLLQTRGESTGTTARKGAPPLLDFPTAGPLARAVTLYRVGKRSEAGAVFAREHSLAAEIGAAFSRWPNGSLDAIKRLVAANPRSGLAELHLGLALYWSGRDGDAVTAWRRAAALEPDEPTAITALDLVNPDVAPFLPPIVVDAAPVPAEARSHLLTGIRLWDLEHSVSARRELAAAVALAPHSPEALVAAAVARFSPTTPLAPFPALGPLTAEFRQAAVVRLHLGILLLWTRQVAKGKAQLRLAISEQPSSLYAQTAMSVLNKLGSTGTK